jgi:hypothetical protein
MDFHWEISSRTGDTHTGADEFPTQEQKDSANLFHLILSCPSIIEAPYGQSVIGTDIQIVVPDDCRLVFKRRVQLDYGGATDGERRMKYIIAFEKVI